MGSTASDQSNLPPAYRPRTPGIPADCRHGNLPERTFGKAFVPVPDCRIVVDGLLDFNVSPGLYRTDRLRAGFQAKSLNSAR